MKNSLLRTYLLFTVLIFTGCGIEHHVQRVKEVKPISKPGIYYSLPETVVQVTVPVNKVTVGPGALGKLLKDTNVTDDMFEHADGKPIVPDFPDKKSVENYIGKINDKDVTTFSAGNTTISSLVRPDSDALFVVLLEGSSLTGRDVVVELTDAGLILNGTTKFDDKKVETGVKTLEVIASLAGKAIGFAGPVSPRIDHEKVDERVRRILSTVVAIQAVRQKIADLAAAQGGAMPAETFAKKLTELRSIEQKLLASFIKKSTKTWTAVLHIVPEKELLNTDQKMTVQLMEINSSGGVKSIGLKGTNPKVDLRGEIPKSFKTTSSATTTLKLDISVAGSLYAVRNTSGDPKKHKPEEVPYNTNTGFVYRMPVGVDAIVYDQTDVSKGFASFAVAQFGPMVALPPKPGGSASSYAVAFHPNGGLKKAELSSTPPDISGVVSSIGTGAGTILDAIGARDKAEAEAADEVNQLKREAEELKLRLEIQQLKSQLDATQTP